MRCFFYDTFTEKSFNFSWRYFGFFVSSKHFLWNGILHWDGVKFYFRPTELRFQFTIQGFSKCDAAFVYYSLFESYSLSGPKI